MVKWKWPARHSTTQLPGRPLRILLNSTFHPGYPTPGMALPSPATGPIFHLATAAIAAPPPALPRNKNPVTLLCSTASCNRRDAIAPIDRTSPTTAASPSHFNASSIAHNAAFSFLADTKTTLSASTPKAANPGGKTRRSPQTQITAPPRRINDPINAAKNPLAAAIPSSPSLRTSCIAPVGKTPCGKAAATGPNPISTVAAEGGRNP
jgi:hypothetical protein